MVSNVKGKVIFFFEMLQSLCEFIGVRGEGSVGRFVWQLNVRKGLNSKDSCIGELIDFDRDFQVPNSYEGPRLEFPSHYDSKQKEELGCPELSDDFVRAALECFTACGVYMGTDPPPEQQQDKGGNISSNASLSSPPTAPSSSPKSPPPPPPKRHYNKFGLHRKYVYRILQQVEAYYRSPINSCPLVRIEVPKDGVVNVCGDVHGQFYDLLKIFREKGAPSKKNLYLFNGDIVDKGPMSLECILYLFLLKLTKPDYVFINRGNHENANLNARNGFTKEVRSKSGDDHFLPKYFGEIFRWMPLVHLINSRILVMHGGLSSNLSLKLDDIRIIQKPTDPHVGNLTGDLLWSDPVAKPGVCGSSRGIGVFFGQDVTRRFLENNDLLCIIRSHSEIKDGCGLNHEGCYTVYSAPSNAKGVKGGVLTIEGNFLGKEGCVFNECTREEVEEFKQGKFYRKHSLQDSDGCS